MFLNVKTALNSFFLCKFVPSYLTFCNMKIVCIKGGLGNQLFEYCRYRELKRQARERVMLFYDARRTKQHGGVALAEAFELSLPASNVWVALLVWALKLLRAARLCKRLYDDERDDCVLIDDYSQHRRFIVHAASYLHFRVPAGQTFGALIQKHTYPVSIHVRRGDYLHPANLQNFGVCSANYFLSAAKWIKERQPQASFFVFSDDMAWAKKHLAVLDCVFVEHAEPQPDYTDLYLMTCCKGHIIANSTFSFWGAYLSSHPEGITVYPHEWFANPAWTMPDIFPEHWVRWSNRGEIIPQKPIV